ncbi:MAG: 60S ribosomal export protein NMD3 [Halobacteriaceae archaeon]
MTDADSDRSGGRASAGPVCPDCGDPVSPDREGAGSRRDRALCDACYLDRYDLVSAPDRVELDVCGTCGAMRIDPDDGWTDVGARDYADVAVEAVSDHLAVHADAADVGWGVEAEQVDETTVRIHCTVAGSLRGRAVEETVTVPAKLSRGTCRRCGRIAGDDFASVVQVRATDRTPTAAECETAERLGRDLVADRAEAGDRDAFLTAVEETDDGLDMKLSTTGLGRAVADRILAACGGTLSESETLVTEDGDGQGVYRVTYAVRLPRVRPGDVVDPDDGDGPVLVQSVGEAVRGVRLATGDAYESPLDGSDVQAADRLGRREDGAETTVVTVEDEHAVQVIDPETFEARTVPRPDHVDASTETVTVFRSQAGLYVLPPDDD